MTCEKQLGVDSTGITIKGVCYLCPRINQETIEGKRVGKLCK
jgi:hypothetical protein